MIVEGDDIYGDGVNVAARLQALAATGGVAVSRTVRDQVAGKVAADVRRSRRAHGQEHRAARARVRVATPRWRRATAAAVRTTQRSASSDLRAAVRQHERRSRAGVFQRRHHRGHHHRSLQGLGAGGRVAQHRVHVQGKAHRDRAGRAAIEGHARARRQRAQVGQPRAHHRAADRRPPPTATCGPSATTATSTTSSRCRTRSPRRSSGAEAASCCPTRRRRSSSARRPIRKRTSTT